MESYDEIVARMKSRREMGEIKPKSAKKSKWKIINRLLGLLCLLLAFLIYANKDPDASVINSIFNTSLNFNKLNTTLNSFSKEITSFFNLNKTKTNQVVEVSQKSKFLKVGNYVYTNDNMLAYSIGDGTVLNIKESVNYTYQIIIKYDNGYTGVYSDIVDSDLNKYDRLKYDDVVGVFSEQFVFYLVLNDDVFAYEDIIQD